MKKILAFAIMLLIAAPCVQGAARPVKKTKLNVLYVGGTAEVQSSPAEMGEEAYNASVRERMAAFEKFLNDYFTSVTVVHAGDYTQAMSDKFDVTILDGVPEPVTPRYTNQEKGIYRSAGYFTDDFDRPILTVGEVGDRVGRRNGIKNDWYCLCLDADALNWRPEHPIFNGPFKVKMTVENKPTPENAYHYPYYHDGPIPDEIPMWTVQTKGYMTHKGFRVGMVARPWGYEDSPETEYISSGVCAKTLDAVAIGRHGNFFHWGFAASPAFMTEEARPVLANAIVYISKFAGQTPIARKYNDRIATREYLKELKYLSTYESYEERMKSDEQWAQNMLKSKKEAEEKKARGEKLTRNEEAALGFTPPEPRSFADYVARYNKDFFHLFGTDTEAYHKFYDDNYDYFFGEGFYHIELDEDVKSLGIPNYDRRILDEAIKLLESGKDPAKGRRILARYTLEDFATPAEWRAWYDKYRDRMFFTESGGWVFLINSREPGLNDYRAKEERRAALEVSTGETSDAEPVAVAAEMVTMQDGSRMLYVKFRVHPGYHIYSEVASEDPFIRTSVDADVPQGYSAGEWTRPFGRFYTQGGTRIYEDQAVFTRLYTGAGQGEVRCTVTYQCCDSHICFPPEKKEFVLKVE